MSTHRVVHDTLTVPKKAACICTVCTPSDAVVVRVPLCRLAGMLVESWSESVGTRLVRTGAATVDFPVPPQEDVCRGVI